MLCLMLYFKFKSLRLMSSFIGCETLLKNMKDDHYIFFFKCYCYLQQMTYLEVRCTNQAINA
jgi:hypothetical protein